MTLSHIVKRYMHTTSVKNRGAVTQLGWYPRDHMPGNYPKNEEERRAAAIKYGLRPEDYQPYDPDDAINHMGDYPDVGIVTYQQKDPYEAYTDRHFCRNWCEPVPRQFIRYRPDRWTYTGLEEEEFEFTQFVSRVLAVALPFALLYFIANSYSEEMGLIKGWISIKFKVPHMPKQYAYDFYRAFPYEDPIKYPILNYSFEPADKYDPEGDNARAPFNPTQRMQLQSQPPPPLRAMHYLEDVIEMLEYLPEEVRKKCLQLQQSDLLYQGKMDKLKADSREYFAIMKTLSSAECERRNKEMQQRYQEAHELADEKVQITEYLQSVLEKYQERILKELVEFKADLESDNPDEVDLIEKAFIQSIANSPPHHLPVEDFNGDDLHQQTPSTSATMPPTPTQMLMDQQEAMTALINGHGHDVEGTPKSHHQHFQQYQRMLAARQQQQAVHHQQQYDDFKIPHNIRRPAQSLDSRALLQQQRGLDEDIFDTEISPPTKRQKPSQRTVGTGAAPSTKSSRDTSPRSSISSSSPRSTSPTTAAATAGVGHPSKFPFHPRADFHHHPAGPSEGGPPVHRQQRIGMKMLPSFSEAQSRHGRPRKLTKKVEQMLSGNNRPTGPPTGARQPPHPQMRRRRRRRQEDEQRAGDEHLEEIDEEFEEEGEDEEEYEEGEEGEEEEGDDRAWCYCKQGSAGNMVACDNKNCPYEWFHYECVGIQQPPKGLWYCPTCSMKLNNAQRSRSTSTDHQQIH